ncbi:hypothetical protein J6590_005388 [Homalodisca vitripennis]|nr:hypothetical protein J6590_005388 [Homalodisca vitripennis]
MDDLNQYSRRACESLSPTPSDDIAKIAAAGGGLDLNEYLSPKSTRKISPFNSLTRRGAGDGEDLSGITL